IIFGFLTIRNIHNQQNCIIATITTLRLIKSRRNQNRLPRMLIVQISIYIIFSLAAAVTYSIITFMP
ncbi:unnamed protein product, partial [Rotaria sp. Silwood2]